jgi:glycosyltransferase involved in cell wall biosynthesis
MSAKKLRILHCIPGLYGGGAERQLSYLSAELERKGVDVHIAYHLDGLEVSKALHSGVTYHELPVRGNHDPLLLWQLIGVIRRVQPDLVQTWILQMDILGGMAALITGTPFLMTERTVAGTYAGLWKENLRFWMGRRAALIVANSPGGREYWLSRKHPNTIKVVPNAVPVEEIREALPVRREICGVGENTEILLFAGRYSAEKNLATLLDALFLVVSERSAAIALLFGVGPLKNELVAQLKRHHMEDRIRIMDYSEQLWSWMKRASVFVSISHFEGSPNTVCEAAAAGCPLVLSDIPPHRQLLGEDAALLVPLDAPREIANGILDVLCNPESAKRRAKSAYAKVSSFTVNSVTDKYLDLYNLILAKRGIAEK